MIFVFCLLLFTFCLPIQAAPAKMIAEPDWKYKTRGFVVATLPFDLDGDGKKEVIVGSDTLYVLDYSGKLSWKCEEACRQVKSIRSLYVADLDGDGHGEILAGSVGADPDTPSLFVFNFQGQILWKTKIPGEVTTLYAIDLNQDGKAEILAGSTDGTVYVWDYQGNLQWKYKMEGSAVTLTAFDLGKKGQPEILVGSEDGSVYLLGNKGELQDHFSTKGSILSLYGVDRKAETGFKPDSVLVLVGSLDSTLYVLEPEESQGTFSLKLKWKFETSGSVNVTYAFDLEGNGSKEILLGSGDHKVYILDEQGQLKWTFTTGGEIVSLQAFDLDRDGKGEVIVASNDQQVYILNSVGDPKWKYETPKFISGVFGVDIDGDGRGEVVIGSDNLYVFGYPSNLVTYGPIWNYEIKESPSVISPVDLDGDGNLEILIGTLAGELYVIDGQGNFRGYYTNLSSSSQESGEQGKNTQILQTPYQLTPRGEFKYPFQSEESITALSVYDLDRDGKDEIVVGLKNGEVILIQNEAEAWRYQAPGSISAILVTELGKDKTPEILVGSDDGTLQALDLYGAQKWNYHTGGKINILLAEDLDEDDKKEILIGGDENLLYVLDVEENPLQQGKLQWYYETGGSIFDISAGDLDANGQIEIILVCRDGTLHVLNYRGQPQRVQKIPNLNAFYPEDLDGNETIEMVTGSDDGTLAVFDTQLNLKWSQKLEKGITGLIAMDLYGDHRGEVLVGCGDENLYIFDYQGRLIWKYKTPGVIQSLSALDIDQDENMEIILSFEKTSNILVLSRVYNLPPFIREARVEALGKEEYRYTLQIGDVNGGYSKVGLEVYSPSRNLWRSVGEPKLAEPGDKLIWQLSGLFNFWDHGLPHRYRFSYNDQGLTGTWGEFRGPDIPGIPWYIYTVILFLSLVVLFFLIWSYFSRFRSFKDQSQKVEGRRQKDRRFGIED
jgi:WD40 repeat protein